VQTVNRQVVYARQPDGAVTTSCFEVREGEMPQPQDGQVLIANRYLSLDPYMRMRMIGPQGADELGQVMTGRVVGTVAASKHPNFREGDSVFAMGGWEQYSVTPGDDVRHIEVGNIGWEPYLGVLGFTGLTAWVGLQHYGAMTEGESLFVSAASGAVGSVVGQIAKIHGLTVAGCAGSDDKVAYLKDELGFDQAFNYKTIGDLPQAVAAACPTGVDINFENVGGQIFDAVFRNMNHGGRLLICGGISQYNLKTPDHAVPNLLDFITKQLTMRGFSVRNHADEIGPYIEMAKDWFMNGQLKGRETVTNGIEHAPEAFLGLFSGSNFGKQIVKVDE
jgi:NADPH-dependent curcumin reductase CurA